MIELKDQMNRTIRLEKIPERIVSLVPSQTELLFYLGLENRVVGITKFCIHPDHWFKTKKRVGGTKNINLELISDLKPDLIIGNKEENTKDDITKLEASYPVYMSDIYSIEDALKMISDVGILVSKSLEASVLINQLKSDRVDFPRLKGSVLYLIWAQPYMAAGPNTFIGNVITQSGLKNVITENQARYVELNEEEIMKLKPDYIFLSSEPFPFKEAHANELRNRTTSKIVFVDGEQFSWYGSRMLSLKKYFSELAGQL